MSGPVLQEQMEQLHGWFGKVYPQHKLKIYTKWNIGKAREEYILDLFFNSTSRSLAFQIPGDAMEVPEVIEEIKDRWVPWAQQRIIQVLQ